MLEVAQSQYPSKSRQLNSQKLQNHTDTNAELPGSLDLTENDGHNDDLNDDDGVGWIERWFDPSRRLLRRKKVD